MASDPALFIRANTKLMTPPLVPEISLYLAEESLPIWQKTEEELGEMNVPPPYWAFAWAGGQALARYVIDTPELVRGRHVLDIGSGSGLVAIAAARSGAQATLANDLDAFATAAIALNAAANQVSLDISMADLVAGPVAPPAFDVLLIGDLFYEKTLASRVLAFAHAARSKGATVLVGDPGRSYAPKTGLSAIAHYRVPVTRELEDSEIKATTVWTLAG
ncbi:MAG: methyltransferase [Hyphomicrobiaceae bacterium]